MRIPTKRGSVEGFENHTTGGHSRPSSERQAELAMFRVLLNSMRKRHAWDRIKCAIATGIPVFWILLIVLGPHLPAALAASVPPSVAGTIQPILEGVPAVWTIAISLGIAGFQWYNLAHFQRHVIPLVRDMYERALTRRDPDLLTLLGDALRFRTLRESFRTFFQDLFAGPR